MSRPMARKVFVARQRSQRAAVVIAVKIKANPRDKKRLEIGVDIPDH